MANGATTTCLIEHADPPNMVLYLTQRPPPPLFIGAACNCLDSVYACPTHTHFSALLGGMAAITESLHFGVTHEYLPLHVTVIWTNESFQLLCSILILTALDSWSVQNIQVGTMAYS